MQEVDFARFKEGFEGLAAFGEVSDCAEDVSSGGFHGFYCVDSNARGGSCDQDDFVCPFSYDMLIFCLGEFWEIKIPSRSLSLTI